MPNRREFEIRRYDERYGDRRIVCDFCFRHLNQAFYYEVYEVADGLATRPNPYPFHTVDCARSWIQREVTHRGEIAIITTCSNELDDPQEEETE